jgi:hypothetical protein
MSLPPHLKAQLRGRLAREPSPTRRECLVETRWLGASAAAAMALVFLLAGGVHIGARPGPFVVAEIVGWCGLAALAAVAALHRGRSMLGPRRRRLILTAALVPPAAFAWTLLWNALYPETLVPTPGRPGLRCLGLTALLGLWPLLALARARRGTAVHGALAGAALGVAVAAAAGVLVELWCPIADPAHVAVGHILPFALFAGLGAIAGTRIVALPAR